MIPEQHVIGALLLNNKNVAKISDWLKPADFGRHDCRGIYEAMLELETQRQPFDAVTLSEWMQSQGTLDDIGGLATVVDFANNAASARNVVAYAEIVLEHSRQRQLADIGGRLAAAAERGDARQLMATTMHELSQLSSSTLRGGLQTVRPMLSQFMTELQKRYSAGKQVLGIETPWPVVNQRLGGWRDGTLYVIGARPSMGKSVWACQAAAHAALAGKRTALFSVEMTADECMGRMVAGIVDLPYGWVDNPSRADHGEEDHNWAKVTAAIGRLHDAPLLIDATPAVTIEQVMARARRAHMQQKLDLIFIDHLHDLKIKDPRHMRHEIGEAVQGCKTMAKTFGCPVVLLSQLRRTNHGARPTLTDLRESGEIEQKADVALFLHRPDYYDAHDQAGLLEVIPAKGRNIDTGGIMKLSHNFSRMRIDPRSAEDTADDQISAMAKPKKPKMGYA